MRASLLMLPVAVFALALTTACRKKCGDAACDTIEGKWVWQYTEIHSEPRVITGDSCFCAADIEFKKSGQYALHQVDANDDTGMSRDEDNRYTLEGDHLTLRGYLGGPVLAFDARKHEFTFTVEADTFYLRKEGLYTFVFVRG